MSEALANGVPFFILVVSSMEKGGWCPPFLFY
jgi:hypothetical protein